MPRTIAPIAVPVALAAGRAEKSKAPDSSFTVDCDDCMHQGTSICDDCVVSFIVGRHPEDAVIIDADEARAVQLLERAGLVPGMRHAVQAG